MKRKYYPESMSLISFIDNIKERKIITNDDYQRNSGVWKKRMKEELIATILIGLPIGVITLWEPPLRDEKNELIDGLQRVSAISEYMDNKFSLSPDLFKTVVSSFWDELQYEKNSESKKVFNGYSHGSSVSLKYKDLPSVMKRAFDNYVVTLAMIINTPINDIREYFVRIQNQEALKAGEVIRSLPNNEFVSSIKKLGINEFAEDIKFNNKREDLVLLIAMMYAVYEKSGSLNASSSKIIKFTSKVKHVDPVFIRRLEDVIYSMKGYRTNKRTTKATMKLFLLLTLVYGGVEGLSSVEIFNTSSAFVVETKRVNGNTQDSIDMRDLLIRNNIAKFRLTQIFKGTHSSENLDNKKDLFKRVIFNMSLDNKGEDKNK